MWNWERHVLPPEIETDGLLVSSSQDGLREGCQAAIFRLSDDMIRKVKRDGIAALGGWPRPPNENERNPYSLWRETPGWIDLKHNGQGSTRTVYGLYAMGGCGGDSGERFGKYPVELALTRPGSYFATTANREGIIIVAPIQKIVAYYYFG